MFAAIWVRRMGKYNDYIAQAGTITLVLNFVMMITGYYVAKLLASDVAQENTFL